MSRSYFSWLVVFSDKTAISVSATSVENALLIVPMQDSDNIIAVFRQELS